MSHLADWFDETHKLSNLDRYVALLRVVHSCPQCSERYGLCGFHQAKYDAIERKPAGEGLCTSKP